MGQVDDGLAGSPRYDRGHVNRPDRQIRTRRSPVHFEVHSSLCIETFPYLARRAGTRIR